jgi:MoxR-like ATPase
MKFSSNNERQQLDDNESNLDKETNFAILGEDRKELRKALMKAGVLKDDVSQIKKEIYKEGIGEIDEKVSDFNIKKIGGISKAKALIRGQREQSAKSGFLDEEAIIEELGQNYFKIDNLSKKAEEFKKAISRESQQILFGGDTHKISKRILDKLEKEKTEIEKEFIVLSTRYPKIARAHELIEYKKGLHMESGIAMTPSVKKYIEFIEKKMITGRPIFLHGPTGTGKTSIGKLVAETLTGKRAEVVFCNEQTRESDIWGKMGIENDSGTPVTKFVYGKQSRAIQEGKPIIYDEFNRLTKDQQSMIKGLFSYRPGKMVPITGNKELRMAHGHQIICTANLKSEKHSDRQDLPDEIKREFKQNHLEINYSPVSESYDIMLSRLMNADGSIDLSWHDINVTLPKLAEAMVSIQEAYAGELSDEEAKSIGALSASNVKSQLKSFVMTQGSVSDILSQWGMEKESGKTFAEFIDDRLVAELTFGSDEESREDHILAAKIFALKGFLKTVTPEELGLPKDIFNGVKIKAERGEKSKAVELKEKSAKVVHITLSELAELDPFNVREKDINPLDEFSLGSEEGAENDAFSKGVANRLKSILGKENNISSIISAEYTYTDPDTKVEKKENVELNIKEKLQEFISLYNEVGIDILPDLEENIKEIWSRNSEDMQQAIEENGFDDILIIPADLDITELSEKMKMKNGYYDGISSNTTVSNLGGVPLQSSGIDKSRIVLVHKTQNLKDRPELKATLNVKAEDVNIEESLSIEDYIIFQKKYFKESGKYLDEDGWTWTPRTKSGSRFVHSYWNPVSGKLFVNARVAGYSRSNLGCRPSRYFV